MYAAELVNMSSVGYYPFGVDVKYRRFQIRVHHKASLAENLLPFLP